MRISSLRENAQWVKLNLPCEQRKRWVYQLLASHLRFPLPRYLGDSDDFAALLIAFKSLPEPQRQVFRTIYRSAQVAPFHVRFPDSHCLEIQRNFSWLDVRSPGAKEWEGTLLKSPWDILNWVDDTKIEKVEVQP